MVWCGVVRRKAFWRCLFTALSFKLCSSHQVNYKWQERLTKAQLVWLLSGSPTHLLLEVGWGTWLVWVLSGVKKGERRRSTQALFAFTDRRTLAIKGTHADDEDDCRPHFCH